MIALYNGPFIIISFDANEFFSYGDDGNEYKVIPSDQFK